MQTPIVLLVSRDEDALAVFGAMLRHVGFSVRELTDPATVVQAVERERPALVVTNFPIAAGDTTVTELLRSSERTAHVPILNVTSHVLPHELARAEAAGVTASLAMPARFADLVDAVQRLVRDGREPG